MGRPLRWWRLGGGASSPGVRLPWRHPPGAKALSPEAKFEVLIEDIARADALATVIGRQVPAPARQPPFRFAITDDERSVTPRGRYSLRATVRHRGLLPFATDTITPVRLDGGDPPVELLLRRAAGSGHGQRRQIVAPLAGTAWRRLMLGGQQVGVGQPPGRPIEPELLVDEPRVAGSGGCNRLIGGFSLQGETLRLSQLASTQMTCGPEVMDLERRQAQPAAPGRRRQDDAAVAGG